MKKIIIVVTILCGVILAGCHNENTEQALPATGDDTRNEIQKETPISEALSKKERQIWYEILGSNSRQELGKDSKIAIYIFENGKVAATSSSDNVKLGDIAKMTDDEIIKKVIPNEELKKSFSYSFNLKTDATGNNTEIEQFISEGSRLKRLDFTNGYAKVQVYDQWFSGVHIEDYEKWCFVTRDPNKDGSLSFVLDQPGTKGVTVDE